MEINTLLKNFPAELTEAILLAGTKDIQEIRIIGGKNCVLIKNNSFYDTQFKVSQQAVMRIVDSFCRGSVYAAQSGLVNGYITVSGGHRIGVCGKMVTENGKITHMTDISALCIRISREILGAADEIMPFLEYNGKLYNTLIVSPPGCGKTTVLRDAARILGKKFKVCIADERSEIAGTIGGLPRHDVGAFTCVMDSVPKADGISILLRTMAPQIIITDETGSHAEEKAICEMINSGVKIITTAHGYSEKDILRRKYLGSLVRDGIFERIIVLSGRRGPATVEKIIADGRVMVRA